VARRRPQENREEIRMLRRMLRPDAWRRRGRTEFNKLDAEELATRIRELAVDAHHALNDPLVTPAEMSELSRRVEELRKAARSARLSEIDRWLHQVQRRVEERWAAARLTTRA
jgi:hypothetical protein